MFWRNVIRLIAERAEPTEVRPSRTCSTRSRRRASSDRRCVVHVDEVLRRRLLLRGVVELGRHGERRPGALVPRRLVTEPRPVVRCGVDVEPRVPLRCRVLVVTTHVGAGAAGVGWVAAPLRRPASTRSRTTGCHLLAEPAHVVDVVGAEDERAHALVESQRRPAARPSPRPCRRGRGRGCGRRSRRRCRGGGPPPGRGRRPGPRVSMASFMSGRASGSA